jgi:hypothetical protein
MPPLLIELSDNLVNRRSQLAFYALNCRLAHRLN